MAPIKEVYSKLGESLKEGKWTWTGEIEPEKTTNLDEIIHVAKQLAGHVVAANVTDNPQSFGCMNSLVPSYLIQKEAGLEAIWQVTCRDRNRLGLLSDILAAGHLGIKNILALTGDHTTSGDTPQSMPVFDLDSAQLVYMINKINEEGKDLAGNEIEDPPKFHIGVAGAPGADPFEPEILKIERKIKVGGQFIQTQVVYDMEIAKRFLNAVKHLNVPTLIGICPLKSYKMAKWMDEFCPGIIVPPEILEDLKKIKELPKEQRREKTDQWNLEFFEDWLKELKKTTNAAGCHIMAVGFEYLVADIVKLVK
ncbi:MAG: methylenetetrahydrofolate reductase [Candidatus Freyrarchaeum guaymaensis]|nr:methylenetetrahydrofolate reductase [Candidatus Sigynarchaeota archaeon]